MNEKCFEPEGKQPYLVGRSHKVLENAAGQSRVQASRH